MFWLKITEINLDYNRQFLGFVNFWKKKSLFCDKVLSQKQKKME